MFFIFCYQRKVIDIWKCYQDTSSNPWTFKIRIICKCLSETSWPKRFPLQRVAILQIYTPITNSCVSSDLTLSRLELVIAANLWRWWLAKFVSYRQKMTHLAYLIIPCIFRRRRKDQSSGKVWILPINEGFCPANGHWCFLSWRHHQWLVKTRVRIPLSAAHWPIPVRPWLARFWPSWKWVIKIFF